MADLKGPLSERLSTLFQLCMKCLLEERTLFGIVNVVSFEKDHGFFDIGRKVIPHLAKVKAKAKAKARITLMFLFFLRSNSLSLGVKGS